jgi:LmbE family N-acetylglucosaminyl deacetylase
MYTWATVCHLPVTIVSVTDGEAACPEVPDLKAVRRRELEAARRDLARTGIDIVHLEIPDGQVEQHRDRVLEALERIAPEGVTVIAPFEHDQHADHDACGLAARQLARLRRVTLAQYPIWAWHQATPAIFSERRLGRFMLSEAAREAKQTAIQRFASQLRDRPGGPIVPPTVLEHFNRAYEMFVLQ